MIRQKRLFGLLILQCLFTTFLIAPVFSQNNIEKKVDDIFKEWNKPDSPGIALAVFKNGEIIYKNSYGMSNLVYDIPITTNSPFHVASISKQFTTFSIFLLEKEGKLSADDDIRKYFPEMHDFGKKITLRHLIHHTSGLRDQWDLLSLAGWRSDDIKTQEDVLGLIFRQKELNFDPGEEYLYSNTGYTLLAETVKRVSQKSLKEFAEEYIFKPLGMNDTHFHNDHNHIVKNRTSAYTKIRNGYRINIPDFDTYGATSLFTTVEDFLHWDNNFYDGKIGGMDTIEKMYKKGVLNSGEEISYAGALGHGSRRGLKTIGHGGADAGYRSNYLRFPDQKFSVVVFANTPVNAGSLARKVADLYLEEEYTEDDSNSSGNSNRNRLPGRQRMSNEAAASYAGIFYSEELDTWYKISVDGNDTYLERKKFDPVKMVFRGEDLFSAGRIRLQFQRENGRVAGFALTTGRVRNLRFERDR